MILSQINSCHHFNLFWLRQNQLKKTPSNRIHLQLYTYIDCSFVVEFTLVLLQPIIIVFRWNPKKTIPNVAVAVARGRKKKSQIE